MRTRQEVLGEMSFTEFSIRCLNDFKFFCERLLGLSEYGGIHKHQLEWFKLIRDNDKVLIQAPSGFSKTTIFEAIALFYAWNYKNKKIMIVANTEDRSKQIVSEINKFINDNEIINELRPKDYKETWNKSELVTTTGCRIFLKPYTENMRGERVDFALLDEADSKPYRKISIFSEHVLSRLNPGAKLALISTPDSTTGLMSFIKDKDIGVGDYVFRKYPAIINMKVPGDYWSGESIWNERFPLSELKKRHSTCGEYAFRKIYLCDEKAENESSIFKTAHILNCFDYSRKFEIKPTGGMVFIGCDFAYSNSPRADQDVFVVLEKKDTYLIIRHIEILPRGALVEVKVDKIQELYEQYKPVSIVFDATNIGSQAVHEALSRGLPIVSQNFNPSERKDLIQVLKYQIEYKKLVIPRNNENEEELKITNELVTQLVGFVEKESENTNQMIIDSSARHDDIAMALMMVVKEACKYIDGDFFNLNEDADERFKEVNMLNLDKRMNWDWNKL